MLFLILKLDAEFEFSVEFEKQNFFWSDTIKKVMNPRHASAGQSNVKHVHFLFLINMYHLVTSLKIYRSHLRNAMIMVNIHKT